MTMRFRAVKAGLVGLLGTAAAGQYRVVGYQPQNVTAEGVAGNDRLVQVFYSEGQYPTSSGSLSGPVTHLAQFKIQLTASTAAEGDLTVLDNPASTPGDLQLAIALMSDAQFDADGSIDELYDLVYQAIMDPSQINVGTAEPVGSRWIEGFRKDEPVRRGELVILTAEMILNLKVPEELNGVTGTAGQVIDTEVEFDEDTTGKAGVDVDITGS
jgi:hypothetical protein